MVVLEVKDAELWVVDNGTLLCQLRLLAHLLLVLHALNARHSLCGFQLELLAVGILEPAHRQNDFVFRVVAAQSRQLVPIAALHSENFEHRNDG